MAKSSFSRQIDSLSLWSRGNLSFLEIGKLLYTHSLEHNLMDQAAHLSFYLLLALFPLLIVLSSLAGFVLSSHSDIYWRLLSYVELFMPMSAHTLFSHFIAEIRAGASGGKLSLGLIVSLWTASSGTSALIEALNIAFDVSGSRPWWHRRLVALALTIAIGLILSVSLLFLLASMTAGQLLEVRIPVLNFLSGISTAVRWMADIILLFFSLTLLYSLGPNIKRRRWQGIVPGTCFALGCWLFASWALKLYLSGFGSLSNTYGSLAGVVALLFWLYASATAILLGGELNAIIWHATACKED